MKICLTTYIYGDLYQDYIPYILYSIGKSYPDYQVMLFINGKIRADIIESLKVVDKLYTKYTIIENTFDDCPNMYALKAQSLRWVLWNEQFEDFDYIYYIDSDILYIAEPIPLHLQHIRHMEFINAEGVSNILRKKTLPLTDLGAMYASLKVGGYRSFLKYLYKNYEYRVSGLHFVECHRYFNLMTPSLIDEYRKGIYNGTIYRQQAFINDEVLLYKMMARAGFNMSKFAVQKSSASMFGFNNPQKKEFCPHHGIHLGIFRFKCESYPQWVIEQLESEDYKYYIQKFRQEYMTDNLFLTILSKAPNRIKEKFAKMADYYDLSLSI